MPPMWHNFVLASADDKECASPRCGLVAADDVVEFITLECPAVPCTDPSNLGPCVMVRAEVGAVCAYCERPGQPQETDIVDY